jgi:pimeloyl-ACP methyl ester carboxylesterase
VAYWREAGNSNAPTLLLIHGFPTASWDWEKIWSDLVARYHVITLDMIGFGFSDKPYLYEYSIMDQADIYDEFLNLRGVKEYHLFSHDYGDTVACELIARNLENTRRPKLLSVAFLNGGLFPETHHRIFFQSLLLSPIGPLVSLTTTKKGMTQNMREVFGKYLPPDQETMDSIWALIKNNHGDRIMHKLIHYILERIENRERWVGGIQKTTVPVKLIDGRVDPNLGGTYGGPLSRTHPQCQCHRAGLVTKPLQISRD